MTVLPVPGLSLKSLAGINIDANSSAGYSGSEKFFVDVTRRGRKICGTNLYPAERPSRVVARER